MLALFLEPRHDNEMSEREQDEAIGRFLREHADSKRKLAAMQTHMESYSKAFASLASCLERNVHDDFNLAAAKRELEQAPLSEFDLGRLLAFLEEYTELRKSVTAGKTRLRELGIDAV